MSDEWKLAQGQKKKNQNDSFKTEEPIIDYVSKQQDIASQREEDAWKEEWNNYLGAGLFEKDFEEGNIEAFKDFILGCRKKKIELNGKRGDLSFSIKSEHPLKVSFDAGDRDSNVVIYDNEVLYSQIEAGREEWNAHYKYKTPTALKRSIYVMHGGQVDINEYFSLLSNADALSEESKQKEIEKANNIRDNILNEHPEFSAGQDGEFYRLEISPSERVEPAVRNNGLGFNEHPDDYCYESDLKDTYGEYVEVAKQFEDHCKYVYSLIAEAYKGLGEQVITQPSKNENIKQDEEKEYEINEFGEIIRPAKTENIETTNEKVQENVEDSKLDNLSDEELDKFIEDMNAKQKEKEQKIERLKKIKRAKELIALSKKQDKEISDLESQIQKEGIEFDE